MGFQNLGFLDPRSYLCTHSSLNESITARTAQSANPAFPLTVSWARSPQRKRIRSSCFLFLFLLLPLPGTLSLHFPSTLLLSFFKKRGPRGKTLTSLAETYLRVRAHASLPWWRRGVESADDALSPGWTNCPPSLATDGAASWFLEGLWPSLGDCPPLNAAV